MTAAAPKPVDMKKIVKVENISKGIVNTCKGTIKAGETGEATNAELRSYNKKLKEVKGGQKE